MVLDYTLRNFVQTKKSYFNKHNCQSGQQNTIQHKVSRLSPPRMYQKSQDCWKDDDSPQQELPE